MKNSLLDCLPAAGLRLFPELKARSCLLVLAGGLFLQSCGGDSPPQQRAATARRQQPLVGAAAPKTSAPAVDSAAHDSDPASLDQVQERILTQLHADPTVGNVGHDFAHLLAIYERSILAGAQVELRTGRNPAVLKLAAAVRDRAQQSAAAFDQLATSLHGRARDYRPDDGNDPFTHGIRESIQVSFRAHAAAQVPDHDFAALLLAQRRSTAIIAHAALATGKLPGPARVLAQQQLRPRPVETRLLQVQLSHHQLTP